MYIVISQLGKWSLSSEGIHPCKYVLALMDVLFSKEEMAKCCFVCTNKSKKPPLPLEKIKLIEGIYLRISICCSLNCFISFSECVAKKYGKGVYTTITDDLRIKANQKCLDHAFIHMSHPV